MTVRRLRNQRGNALLVSLVVVLVITAAGVAVVRFASREVVGAYAARKGATVNACAEAARAYLMSQWKLLGASATAPPPLKVTLEPDSNTSIIEGGHYGQDPTSSLYWNSVSETWVNNVQVIPLNPLSVGSSYVVNDISNRIANMAQPFRVVVHCTQADGREAEVEFAVQWGL
jgi:hypothetical protein